jgi:SAM-dependent methyltransferase
MGQPPGSRWNHNIHFHPLVMNAIRPGAASALDVGTGDGELAGDLRSSLSDVTAVDVDADVLARAAANHRGIHWIHGDFMTYDFGRTFDLVAAVATIHHLPSLPDALQRLADLTSPGGVVVVIGLARPTTPRDRLLGLAGVAQHQWLSRTRNFWQHSAPTVWPPPHTYSEVRECAARVLPGVRWQQFALWRYALTWTKPHLSRTDPR